MAFRANYSSSVAVALLMGIISMIFGGGSGTNIKNNGELDNGGFGFGSQEGRTFGLLAIILGLLISIVGMIGLLLQIFVENVLKVGGYRFFVQNQTGHPGIEVMLSGFKSGHYGNIVLTMFLRDLFIALWTLLFIVPGIVKYYEYMMVPYILAENPGMDRKEAFLISRQMMNGQKWDAFVMDLSFIGWYLLSVLTCGLLAVFYVSPYHQASLAEIYSFNKEKAYREGYIR